MRPDDETARVDLSKPPRGVKVARSLISGIDITCRRVNFGGALPDDVRLFFAAVLRQAVRAG